MNQNPLHLKAVALSKTYLKSEAQLMDVIGEIDLKRIHLSLGYPSVFAYCVGALKLSESQSYTLITVSRKCRQVPALKIAIEEQRVSLSKARRVVSVLRPDNQEEWIKKAQDFTANQLEREVVKSKPLALTQPQLRMLDEAHSKLSIVLSKETETLLKEAQDLLCQNQRRSLSYEETLRSLCEFYLNKNSPLRKAIRNRERTQNQAPLFLGRVKDKSRSPIPNAIKHQVFQRDLGKCQAALPSGGACHSTRWVELHHRIPISLGGSHSTNNLVTLCSGHHKMHHFGPKS